MNFEPTKPKLLIFDDEENWIGTIEDQGRDIVLIVEDEKREFTEAELEIIIAKMKAHKCTL